MKKHFFIILFFICLFYNAQQTFPLRTYTDVPSNSYIKDLDNELLSYEGTWKGTWNGKTVWVYLKRYKRYFTHLENRPYYNDVLIGKFKIVDSNGAILFDNTGLPDSNTKIVGSRFFSIPNVRYDLNYIDPDLCNTTANITINFTDSSKTQLNWVMNFDSNMITSACQYYNTAIPDSLPEEIILTKQ